jgi:GTPase SAR1 family protein
VKHLIIEGCDGSGKTSLIRNLLENRQSYVIHPRASDSQAGPVPKLAEWVDNDLWKLEGYEGRGLIPYIYDRHPLISELLYAPIRWHNRGLASGFESREWVVKQQRRMANLATLVICSPPYEEVERVMQAQGRDAHMPGVFENRFRLWKGYEEFIWPGTVIRYDRTRETPADLITTLEKIN